MDVDTKQLQEAVEHMPGAKARLAQSVPVKETQRRDRLEGEVP